MHICVNGRGALLVIRSKLPLKDKNTRWNRRKGALDLRLHHCKLCNAIRNSDISKAATMAEKTRIGKDELNSEKEKMGSGGSTPLTKVMVGGAERGTE